jgi:1,2-diacylglycerol 3-alpha-glucosyltransferase
MKIAVLFDRFGPYHIARLEAAANYSEIFPTEIFGETSEYQWRKVESLQLQNRITLFNTEGKYISSKELNQKLSEHLSSVKPDVVAVNGWSDRSALSALYWCLRNKVPAIVMSESGEEDDNRTIWKEYFKKKIVKQFYAALVGGIRHSNYLKVLGMKKDNIFFGYDVVDNAYFETETNKTRQNKVFWLKEKKLPQDYFLIVSRFIDKKNLHFVIQAFNDYVLRKGHQAWKLLILGDGPLKSELKELRDKLGLQDNIIFEGFKQYDELPIYFGLAKALIHASTVEQWGLVVNEAMASGLPVAVSERCGCVPELVHEGINGHIFDPYNLQSLSGIMTSFSANEESLEKMGQQSRNIVASLSTNAFGLGLFEAAKAAKKLPEKKLTWDVTALLKVIINR